MVLPILILAALAVVMTFSRQRQSLNVVLVVFDTCRADHVGCYGAAGAATPEVDRLAAEGVLFERAYTQVPLTLPAHTTLFTGTYPEHHRIRDNAAYFVPGEHVTLAEVLRANGYTTAAFIGAFPLDRRFDLDQGFETYDGYFPLDSERPAGAVNAAVDGWLSEQSGEGPYFIFVHYFDPHLRYRPPSPYAERFKDAPYDGEIAYADFCLGELREKLASLCPPDRTLWIFTSDHGEALWDHGEQDHGIFLYDSTVRVPLIWSCPGRIPSGQRSPVIAELADVMPTLLDFLGIAIPEQVQGASLAAVVTGRSESAGLGRSHAETYFPRLRHGWSGLRSIRTDRWLFVAAPREELYDLRVDPGQTQNILGDERGVAARLRGQLRADLDRLSAPADRERPVAEIDPETEARLLSLGYLGRVSKTIHDPGLEDSLLVGPDPKDRIGVVRHLDRARARMAEKDWPGAETELRAGLSIAPRFLESRQALAKTLEAQDRYPEAARIWRGLVEDYPDDALFRMFEAQDLEKAGRWTEAAEAYRATVPHVPDPSRAQAEYLLALARMGMDEAFARERARLLEMRPILPETLNRLGTSLMEIGRVAEALSLLEESTRLFPSDPDAYNLLGWELIESGRDVERGVRLAKRAVELDPDEDAYLDTLGWGYYKQERLPEAIEVLEKAARGDRYPEISHHLALAYLRLGNTDRAASVLRALVERAPEYERLEEVRDLLRSL